ncbi:MAG: phosphoribosylglycinamide formyltransferase [Planctomycetota bacterium]|nr:MAG: phosphoribosylglycinamide formyltransferase [Planctomycetota bacterium]
MTTPIVVFLSGAGRTLANLLDRIDAGEVPARVAMVVASRRCPGADLARRRGVETRIVPGDPPAGVVDDLARAAGAECVALAGYLRLLGVPGRLRGRVVNIHPALLPSFGGRGMFGLRVHRAVLDAGCKVSGCTAHLCDDRYDTGPILAQACCPVEPGDTPESLAARVFALEQELYPRVITAMIEGRVRTEGARAWIDDRAGAPAP